jgi:hypothetical protein
LHPPAASLDVEFLHGQVCDAKSTVKSGDQKLAAPPPKSLLKLTARVLLCKE